MSVSTGAGVNAPMIAPLEAVLFDMDGVITDTANAHAAAWQRLFDEFLKARAERCGEEFHPFDPHYEYRQYVDGKPRLDGVRSFLESRGIELPYGDDDGSERETVYGLGQRKDRYFNAWLEENQVRSYPGTLNLIDDLRAAGIKVAVFSASRNAEAVLRNAGLLDRFDARVDGSDAAELGLPGKPDPAMLLEAARRLDTAPGRTAVVEDAIAGVAAGARGAFGLVIGVARGDFDDDLKTAGAGVVVHDLSELRFSPAEGLTVKTLANLPLVWDREHEIRQGLAGKALAVFLDYDGTLTPIVEDHTKALLAEDMRAAVATLARHCDVIIVSGRDLARLQELVSLGHVWYAGSHGFDIAGPQGSGVHLQKGKEFLTELDEVEQTLQERLTDIEGHSVERKKFSIAVHYRQVPQAEVGKLRPILDKILVEHPLLRLGHGKKVFEIRPDIDWNKGEAVLWFLQQLAQERPGLAPLYVGDDITDEDAFHALAGRGLRVAVRYDESRQTAADYAVADTQDVKRLLDLLALIAASEETGHGAQP
ncbi:trehalose-phosphatase [Marinobacter changyiensis]|uniref:trehalose-phosphatase n=1 Tax=Marinobacter changyiensis TaxID=2604091 RepID=UPI00126559B5|nr:trehalose-phosphatase [Marinobacter changyiensis]